VSDGIPIRQADASSILGLFGAPAFEDPEHSERANILRIVIIGTVLVTTCMITVIMICVPAAAYRCISIIAFVSALGLTLLRLNQLGKTRLAARLFVSGLIALITVLAVRAGGVRSPGVAMYFVIVLMTGLLLGQRPGRIAGLVCAALGFGLLIAEKYHLLPPALSYSSTGIWLLSCLYMGVVLTLLRLPDMMIKSALRHASSELSEKKRAQEQLLENQRLLQTVIEYTPAAVAMFDTEMRYIAYSKRWLTDYRLNNRDLKGLSHYDVFPEIGEAWRAKHKRVLAGSHETHDGEPFLRADGTEDIIRWDVQPWIRGSGEIGGIAIFTEVITDRVRAEEEQGRLREQLLEVQKFEALGTLAGGIAHDFNNILAMIGTNAELGLAEAANEESVRTSFGEIVSATARARDIVRQILYFSRKQETAFETLSLAPIVEEALAFLHATVPTNVEIHKSLGAHIPPVRANASQIYQILMNLGTNSAHAMPSGGVLSVRLDTVNLTQADAAKSPDLHAATYIRLSVQDNGTGMNGETLARMFEPFFTTKGAEGSGLGMSVVQGIVKDHSGAIIAESEPGKGTTIDVYFPAVRDEPACAPPKGAEPVPGKGQHILYVDDEVGLSSTMSRVLVFLGYRCTVISDPRAALEAFRGDPDQFDAVISDVVMPNLSGTDIVREFHAIRPDMPIALTSGRIERGADTVSGYEGVQTWLSKPATVAQIKEALAILFQERPRGAEVSTG
jgi:PAS domain S-box-containing protein